MRRAEIYWAELGPPAGRRPVVIVTRTAAIPVLASVTVVPVTTVVRKIASEVPLGSGEGLRPSAASCDNLLTIPKAALDSSPVGSLGSSKVIALDEALRYALEVLY